METTYLNPQPGQAATGQYPNDSYGFVVEKVTAKTATVVRLKAPASYNMFDGEAHYYSDEELVSHRTEAREVIRLRKDGKYWARNGSMSFYFGVARHFIDASI